MNINNVDQFIRTKVAHFSSQPYIIEPSTGFVRRVVNHATMVEKQRRARINIWFALVALTPYALRALWSLIRSDFVSVLSLPFGNTVSQAYGVFMSSITAYAMLGAGIVLAVYIVGLPRWRKVW
ncbi:MAG: hypothetical protein AAB420_00190 [Patescibacteria group bacterium]